MKTFLIVAVLVAVALAAASSFFVRAGAQQPRATLDAACDPAALPADTDGLVRCRFVAANTGREPLAGVRFAFVPTDAVPPPARYYFFAARLDGVVLDSGPADLDYPIGDIAPGQERVLEIDAIVRVIQPGGAMALLHTGAGGANLAQELVLIDPGAPPGVSMRLQLSQNTEDPRRYQALLTVNDPAREIDTFTADIGATSPVTLPEAFVRQEPLLGEEVFGDKLHLLVVRNDTAAPAGSDVAIGFEILVDDPCRSATLAVVGYVHAPDGTIARPALLDELPIPSSCFEPGAVTSLGQGGSGPDATAADPAMALIAVLVAGVTAALGLVAIRRGIGLVR
jgi:hypothetical protein